MELRNDDSVEDLSINRQRSTRLKGFCRWKFRLYTIVVQKITIFVHLCINFDSSSTVYLQDIL